MKKIKQLIQALSALIPLSDWTETLEKCDARGDILTDAVREVLVCCFNAFEKAGIEVPLLWFDDDNQSVYSMEDLKSAQNVTTWRLTIGKDRLVKLLEFDVNTTAIILFIEPKSYLSWANKLSPIFFDGLDFTKHTKILVNDINEPFGGSFISVQSLNKNIDRDNFESKMPKEEAVRKILHLISDNKILLDPNALSLNWGNLDSEYALPFKRLLVQVMALTLVQDIYIKEGELRVVIRGTKRVDARLGTKIESLSKAHLEAIMEAVEWVYAERQETRHKLFSDRLSLDIHEDKDFILELNEKVVKNALKQAKEKYGFVILDRKDAYNKELRDIMKDVRTQSDLFAAKSRDLMSGLLRDSLAVLFMVGISLVGRANSSQIHVLINVVEVQLFFKVLAVYFTVSAVLQITSGLRDLHLSSKESESWQRLTKEYVTEEIFNECYIQPIAKRRTMFYTVAALCTLIYTGLAVLSFNVKKFVEWFI